MAQLLHIIGPQGTGKSTIGELIVRGLRASGKHAGVVDADEALYVTNDDIRGRWVHNAVVVVVSDKRSARHLDLQSGDTLITLERA